MHVLESALGVSLALIGFSIIALALTALKIWADKNLSIKP